MLLVRPMIDVSFPATDDWDILQFGEVCDQKFSSSASLFQRLTPMSNALLNGGVMELRIILRDTNGLDIPYSSLVEPPTVTWSVTNLDENQIAFVDLKNKPSLGSNELRFSYTIPFFDHQITCYVNDQELNGSPLVVHLSSISNILPCFFCDRSAVQGHSYKGNPKSSKCAGKLVKLKATGVMYGGACSKHISSLVSPKWNLTPQRCNLKKSLKRSASDLDLSDSESDV
jgi:hypothetical protein